MAKKRDKAAEPAPAEKSAAPEQGPEKPKETAVSETASVVGNAWTVGFWTVASRLLGLYRFRLMGAIFGASGVADAFNFAFLFPNVTRRLFGEGLLTSAFVPVFSSRLAKEQRAEANRTASVLFCRLAWWLTAGCVLVMVLAGAARVVLPSMMQIEPRFRLEMELFQWLLPYLIFINLAAVLMAILNSLGHFRTPAFAPVLLNVMMIAACLWVRYGPARGQEPDAQIWLVAYAVLLGGLLQLLIQVPPAVARGFEFTPTMDKSDPGYQEVMDNFKPVVLMVVIFQINVMVDNIIAQVFIPETGPVTYLNMGTSVYQLPWSIFSLALGTAALPALSKLWTQERKEEFGKTLMALLRLTIYFMVPCTVGVMLLSEEIVRLLYGTGRFLENDGEPVLRTAGVVMFSNLGLVFFGANVMLARALYAMKDMRTPTTTSAKSVALNITLNLFFVWAAPKLFAAAGHGDHPLATMKESGIALASTISNAWQTWMMARVTRDRMGAGIKSVSSVGYSLLALAVLGGACTATSILAYRHFAALKDWEGFWPFFAAVAGGLVPFWLVCRQYFIWQLRDKPQTGEAERYRYGVKDEDWPEPLRFQYSLYSTAMAGAIMGFLVWAVRDSLPPEGRLWPAVVQRALAPVAIGAFVYFSASSSMMSAEYEELKTALARKFRRAA
jgi:putative peptidoglycan lipid II flippase